MNLDYSLIDRPGLTPYFFEYPLLYGLIDKSKNKTPPKNLRITEFQIPSYQRRIVWNKQNIRDFIESEAVLFGTVIMALEKSEEPITLLDGLQRFATATALLNSLYDPILAPKPNRPELIDRFETLRMRVSAHAPIFKYNNSVFREYSRAGVRNTYRRLYGDVEQIINEALKEDEKTEEFIKNINSVFLDKQVAIDKYHNFKSTAQLIQTFINMNSTGINLDEADLLRSMIVQQADKLQWDDTEVEQMENRFTEIFQGKLVGTRTLGKHLYKAMLKDPQIVFENWNSLKSDDVEHLLEFIDDFHAAIPKRIIYKDETENNEKYSYMFEIKQCGDLPCAITIWYFYKHVYSLGKNLDFLGGDHETRSDMHILLRAFYRRILDGSIGRIDPIVGEYIKDNQGGPIRILADKLIKNINDQGLDFPPQELWLKIGLDKSGTNRAKRIFNACLLPNKEDIGGKFYPLKHGNGRSDWTLDHIIPQSEDEQQVGAQHIHMVRNLSPLPSSRNKGARHNICSHKLEAENIYAGVKNDHPYLKWLVEDHYQKYKNEKIDGKNPLDVPKFLVVNEDPPIGDERRDKIADLLKNKI